MLMLISGNGAQREIKQFLFVRILSQQGLTEITGRHENGVGKQKIIQKGFCKREAVVSVKTAKTKSSADIIHMDKYVFFNIHKCDFHWGVFHQKSHYYRCGILNAFPSPLAASACSA